MSVTQASWLLCPHTLNSINWDWWEIQVHNMWEGFDYFRPEHLPNPVYVIAMWMLVLVLREQYTCGNQWQGTGQNIVDLMLAHSACVFVLTQGMVWQYSFKQISHLPSWVAGDPFSLFLLLDVSSCCFLEPALAFVELLGELIPLTKMSGNYHGKRKVHFSC